MITMLVWAGFLAFLFYRAFSICINGIMRLKFPKWQDLQLRVQLRFFIGFPFRFVIAPKHIANVMKFKGYTSKAVVK
jgi:hypothetical protein